MIVRIFSGGTSFKGLSAYLTHDPNADTDHRVAWTHTHNCANDHVASAVDEMYWTAQDAELLKQEAGIRAGGRATENTVKHVSLNWSPEDSPTREHMIETGNGFLRHMGWDEHQAVFVAHNDKEHAHIHIMLNAVNPDNGLRLDDNFERRRAQAWAADYELQQERIYCEQRFKNARDREDAMPRNAWEAFQENQKSFERAEKDLNENNPDNSENRDNNKTPKNAFSEEWKILKDFQRQEREDFFAAGKSAFSDLRNSVYRDVRAEFRERWADYFDAREHGMDADYLANMKSSIVADQKAILEERRDEACKGLRAERDGVYRGILDDQREMRAELHARQEAGLDSADFLEQLKTRPDTSDIRDDYRENAESMTRRDESHEREDAGIEHDARHQDSGLNHMADIGSNAGFSLGLSFLSLTHSLLAEFEGSKPITKRREASDTNPFLAAAEETNRNQQRQQRELEEEERERRQRERCAGD